MKIKSLLILLIVFWSSVASYAGQYTVETVPNDHLKSAADYVTNPDRIISEQAEQAINAKIASVESFATAEIAVVLLESVGMDDIDDFANRLFNYWGIGKDQKDNGLLFLLVKDQRQMVFRTGSGLEGVFPDAIASRIIRNEISPLLKEGDFDGGVIAGITKVGEVLENPEAAQEIRQQEESAMQQQRMDALRPIFTFYLIVAGIVFLAFIVIAFQNLGSKRTNHIKYQHLNGWKTVAIGSAVFFPLPMLLYLLFYFVRLKYLRNAPIGCANCGRNMRKLSESEEDAYLTPAQRVEENIQSMDYDVWVCDHCKNREVFPYTKNSRYKDCPHCHARAYYLADDRIINRSTTLSRGNGEKEYICQNCHKKDLLPYIIPMIVLSSGSSGRGGFGGGSFGGGGGSWGGGSTGGGGARGGW